MKLEYAAVKDCLKTASSWGHDRVYNVCDGSVTDIPWGGWDWIDNTTLTVVCVSIAIMFAAGAVYGLRCALGRMA